MCKKSPGPNGHHWSIDAFGKEWKWGCASAGAAALLAPIHAPHCSMQQCNVALWLKLHFLQLHLIAKYCIAVKSTTIAPTNAPHCSMQQLHCSALLQEVHCCWSCTVAPNCKALCCTTMHYWCPSMHLIAAGSSATFWSRCIALLQLHCWSALNLKALHWKAFCKQYCTVAM